MDETGEHGRLSQCQTFRVNTEVDAAGLINPGRVSAEIGRIQVDGQDFIFCIIPLQQNGQEKFASFT